MIYKNQYIKIFVILFILCINLILSTQVQLITAHKKSNGVLLRIVTNSIVDIENIAGWRGQENWFYLTLNGSYLSPKALERFLQEPTEKKASGTFNKTSGKECLSLKASETPLQVT